MIKRFFLYGCILVGLIISCKKDEFSIPSDCTNQTNWIKSGHQWVYEFHSPFIYADTITLNIEDEIRKDVFEIITVADDTSIYAVTTRYIQPCNNDIYISSLSSMDIAFITYKVDGTVGDKWSYDLPTSKGFTATIASEIIAKNVPVSVVAGTFSCLQIREELTSTDPTSLVVETDYYLNNEHGLIKVVSSTQEYSLVRKNY